MAPTACTSAPCASGAPQTVLLRDLASVLYLEANRELRISPMDLGLVCRSGHKRKPRRVTKKPMPVFVAKCARTVRVTYVGHAANRLPGCCPQLSQIGPPTGPHWGGLGRVRAGVGRLKNRDSWGTSDNPSSPSGRCWVIRWRRWEYVQSHGAQPRHNDLPVMGLPRPPRCGMRERPAQALPRSMARRGTHGGRPPREGPASGRPKRVRAFTGFGALIPPAAAPGLPVVAQGLGQVCGTWGRLRRRGSKSSFTGPIARVLGGVLPQRPPNAPPDVQNPLRPAMQRPPNLWNTEGPPPLPPPPAPPMGLRWDGSA